MIRDDFWLVDTTGEMRQTSGTRKSHGEKVFKDIRGATRRQYSAEEKIEILRLVEQSHLPARRKLDKPGIPRTTFYLWYDRDRTGGPETLEDRSAALATPQIRRIIKQTG